MMTHVASSVFPFVPSQSFMDAPSLKRVAGEPILHENGDYSSTPEIQKDWLLDQAIPHMECALLLFFTARLLIWLVKTCSRPRLHACDWQDRRAREGLHVVFGCSATSLLPGHGAHFDC